MTDWKPLTDIPADAITRITPALEALEAAFRPLAARLTPEDESAIIFANVQERGE